jgi:hypothetical protein
VTSTQLCYTVGIQRTQSRRGASVLRAPVCYVVCAAAYGSIRQHTSAYSGGASVLGAPVCYVVCAAASSARLLCSSMCVSIRFTTGFYYSTCVYAEAGSELDPRTQARDHPRPPLASHQRHKLLQIYPPVCASAYVSIRQHTPSYVGIRQHTSALQAPPDLCTCRRRGR